MRLGSSVVVGCTRVWLAERTLFNTPGEMTWLVHVRGGHFCLLWGSRAQFSGHSLSHTHRCKLHIRLQFCHIETGLHFQEQGNTSGFVRKIPQANTGEHTDAQSTHPS